MNYKGYTIYPDGQIRGKGKKMLKHIINKDGYHNVGIYTKGVSKGMLLSTTMMITLITTI